MKNEPCPNCLLPMPVTAEYCGECHHRLMYLHPVDRFIRTAAMVLTWKHSLVLVFVLLFWINTYMPAPYSWSYWIKRALMTETAQCADGVYSFAASSSGQCSGHGGIKLRLSPSS